MRSVLAAGVISVQVRFALRGAGSSPLWDDQGIARLLLTLASLAAMIGMAVPAHADATDDRFLATLRAAGITAPEPDKAIAAGKWVCNMVHMGDPMVDVVKTVQSANPGLREDNAAKFTAIAANVYCPATLSSE
jgi:hypothetical protein